MDQTTDKNRARLYQISKIAEFPAYVLQADADLTKTASLPARAYASPADRTFPCDSPAATWLSHVYYKYANLKRELDIPEIEQNIKMMADFWGISADVKQASEKLAKHFERKKYDDSDFAIVTSDTRQYRMASAAEVKAASAWLETAYAALPLSDLTKIARKLIEKAAQYRVDIPTKNLRKFAALGQPDASKLKSLVSKCAYGVPDGRVKNYFKAAAAALDKPKSVDERLEFADIVEKTSSIYRLGIKRAHLLDAVFGA